MDDDESEEAESDLGDDDYIGPYDIIGVAPVRSGGSDEDEDGLLGDKPRKGTGQIFPAKFHPPSATITPLELFSGRKVFGSWIRYVNVVGAGM